MLILLLNLACSADKSSSVLKDEISENTEDSASEECDYIDVYDTVVEEYDDVLPYAYLVNWCGPADGYAVQIYINGHPTGECDRTYYEETRITIMIEPDSLEGEQSYQVGDGRFIYAFENENGEDSWVEAGSLTLNWDSNCGEEVCFSGSYYFTFANGEHEAGEIEGYHCGGDICCG